MVGVDRPLTGRGDRPRRVTARLFFLLPNHLSHAIRARLDRHQCRLPLRRRRRPRDAAGWAGYLCADVVALERDVGKTVGIDAGTPIGVNVVLSVSNSPKALGPLEVARWDIALSQHRPSAIGPTESTPSRECLALSVHQGVDPEPADTTSVCSSEMVDRSSAVVRGERGHYSSATDYRQNDCHKRRSPRTATPTATRAR